MISEIPGILCPVVGIKQPSSLLLML